LFSVAVRFFLKAHHVLVGLEIRVVLDHGEQRLETYR